MGMLALPHTIRWICPLSGRWHHHWVDCTTPLLSSFIWPNLVAIIANLLSSRATDRIWWWCKLFAFPGWFGSIFNEPTNKSREVERADVMWCEGKCNTKNQKEEEETCTATITQGVMHWEQTNKKVCLLQMTELMSEMSQEWSAPVVMQSMNTLGKKCNTQKQWMNKTKNLQNSWERKRDIGAIGHGQKCN